MREVLPGNINSPEGLPFGRQARIHSPKDFLLQAVLSSAEGAQSRYTSVEESRDKPHERGKALSNAINKKKPDS